MRRGRVLPPLVVTAALAAVGCDPASVPDAAVANPPASLSTPRANTPAGAVGTNDSGQNTSTSTGSASTSISATLVDIVDADTLDVRLPSGQLATVRLVGIDAPEAGTCLGQAATDWTRTQLSPDGTVRLVADPNLPNRGKYDRLLRYVRYDGGTDYGSAFLRAGWQTAKVYNDPPHRLADRYARLDAAHNDPPAAVCTTPEPEPIDNGGAYPVPPPPPDRDCGSISASGFPVRPADPHRFDGDSDGIGCE